MTCIIETFVVQIKLAGEADAFTHKGRAAETYQGDKVTSYDTGITDSVTFNVNEGTNDPRSMKKVFQNKLSRTVRPVGRLWSFLGGDRPLGNATFITSP